MLKEYLTVLPETNYRIVFNLVLKFVTRPEDVRCVININLNKCQREKQSVSSRDSIKGGFPLFSFGFNGRHGENSTEQATV